MKANVHIETALREKRTFLKRSFCTQPFKIANVTEDRQQKALKLMLMSSSPGILDGDEYRFQIEVQDNGSGFSLEAAEKAPSPFFTTRNVGLGLGLTVSRKIIETHHGKLEILNPQSGKAGIVRISLPLESPSNP